MSSELETLDQLLGGDLPAFVIQGLFPDTDHFMAAMHAMLTAGEIRLLNTDHAAIPQWDWSRALALQFDSLRFEITDTGADRIRHAGSRLLNWR